MNRFRSRLDGISRRRFLGGTGAAVMVGLPALEALAPREARGQTAAPRQRLMCVASGSGLPMDEFTPKVTGPNYDLGRVIQSIKPIQSKVSVFTGLGIDEGRHSPGDHGAGVAVTFTCTTPKPNYANTNSQNYTDPGSGYGLGISIDQVMAQQLGSQTRIPSLQLALRDGLPLGDGPYGPIYLKHLSWKDATTSLTPTIDPGGLFDQLFAGYDPTATNAQKALTLSRRISVLDYVVAERDALLPALGAADAQRIDQYFSSVRDVEQQLTQTKAVGATTSTCNPGTRPMTGLSFADTFKAMADLSVLAMQCDATRIISLQISCYRNDSYYAFLGVNDNHHSLSHAADQAAPNSGYRQVCWWIGDQLGYLLTQMNSVIEPTGTLLDNSLVVYNNDCGRGDVHDHLNLPVIVAGSAGGKLPTGRHFAFPSNTPCNGLYVTLLNALGVNIQTFGQKNSGPLTLV